MTKPPSIYRRFSNLMGQADWVLPTMARIVFAGVLLVYFLNSGLTKIGQGFAGIWTPSAGAYAQILPKATAAVSYDTGALGPYHYLVTLLGTWAEFLFPALIVLGLLTRIAALGMIGFIVIQSITEVRGHGAEGTLGAWFDRFPDAAVLDQRALWVLLLLILVIKGAGPISFDRALAPSKQ